MHMSKVKSNAVIRFGAIVFLIAFTFVMYLIHSNISPKGAIQDRIILAEMNKVISNLDEVTSLLGSPNEAKRNDALDHIENILQKVIDVEEKMNHNIPTEEMLKLHKVIMYKSSSLETLITHLVKSKPESHYIREQIITPQTQPPVSNVRTQKPLISTNSPSASNKPADRVMQQRNEAVIVRPGKYEPPPASIVVTSGNAMSTSVVKEIAESTVLLIICSNRVKYLERTLSNILKYHPNYGFPIVISEDGTDEKMRAVVEEFRSKLDSDTRVISGSSMTKRFSDSVLYDSHMERSDVDVFHIHHPDARVPAENGYFKLAKHFKFALNAVFSPSFAATYGSGNNLRNANKAFKRVIILEEDLDIAPDFFEFFTAMAPLLDSEKDILCASAWNDNGQQQFVHDNQFVMRSDFFPGLGWMITQSTWVDDLGPKWPIAYWDDWLREPAQRRDRKILRPEVCRTYHFGSQGVSSGQYSLYLTQIELNNKFVPFTSMDLSYIKTSTAWEQLYLEEVRNSLVVKVESFTTAAITALQTRSSTSTAPVSLRIVYTSLSSGMTSFEAIARQVGCMDNIKAGVPRTAYKGIVSLWKQVQMPVVGSQPQFVRLHITPYSV